MNKQSREALDAYYVEAGSWAQDREEELIRSRRTAWLIAWLALAVAVLLAIALVVLMPLKSVQTVTLTVDKQTGFVQVVYPINPERITPDSALTRSFLTQYVTAREGFDADSLQTDYRRVALWSQGEARSTYVAGQQAGNPESPLSRYPRSTILQTDVKSISSLGPNVAMVRFETRRRDQGGQLQPPAHWVAVINYRFTGEPMRMEDRLINPLGFQVSRYRRDPEAPPPPEPVQQQLQPAINPATTVPVPAPQQPQRQPPVDPDAPPRGPQVEL
jgi:type IV secretion system protein VirB8